MLALLTFAMLIASIVCDNNVANITTTESTISPALSESSVNQSASSLTTGITSSSSLTTVTPIQPNLEKNSTKPAQFPSNRIKHLNTTSFGVCNCDITLECDINCCCDLDCVDDEIMESFNCAMGKIDIEDFYHDEGSMQRCEVDGGLLCIAHDNVASIVQNLHVPFHVEYASYKWPKILQSHDLESHHASSSSTPSSVSHDFYKYGDAIVTYDMNGEIFQTINVPALTIGSDSRCFAVEPVRFLKVKSINCLRSINELCSYNNNLMLQLQNTKIFQRPPKMTALAREALSSTDGIFNIVIESCKQHTFSNNCTQISYTNSNDGINIAEVLEVLGDYVYEDVNFMFFTNDTKIISATVQFFCRNENVCGGNDDLDPTKIIQRIKVDFKSINNKNEKRIRMKSRGYSNGQLILATRLRPLNDSAPSSTEMVLDYFRSNETSPSDFYMKLPEIHSGGKCLLKRNNAYDGIRFNENSQTKCTVELARDGNSNFTTCQQYQHQLIHFLFDTMNLTTNYSHDSYTSDVYVSKFWTPSYPLNFWTRASVFNLPLWNPEMQESEKIISCSNIVTSVNYKFLYSTIKTSGVRKYEHFIENVFIEFGQVDELQFPIDDENQTNSVNIQINVQFVSLFQSTVKSRANVHFNFINLLGLFGIYLVLHL